MPAEKLFKQFPPVSTEEWINKIKADLKGQDFERRLVWKTKEGFNVNPFYREEDISGLPHINTPPGEFPFLRGTYPGKNEWYIRQDINVEDPLAEEILRGSFKEGTKIIAKHAEGAEDLVFYDEAAEVPDSNEETKTPGQIEGV